MAVIAMTREMGSLGKDVAVGLADRLGLELIQHEIVQHVADKMHVGESVVNRFLETRAPWQAAKVDDEASRSLVPGTLYTSCEALRVAALLLAPFLPATAPVILERLGIPDALSQARLPDDAARWGVLQAGTPTTKGSALFPRLDAPGDA